MADPEPERLADVVTEALRRTRQRAVVATGWAKLPLETSGQMLVVDSVPHDWLFPRVAAAVHHGGSGTIGAALRAGVPSVVVPYFFDQPLWAQRLTRLGVAARPLPRSKLTADRLAAALSDVLNDPATLDRARAVSQRVRSEDGVGSAIRVIDDHVSAHHS
jgi:sterol 3beta-glucosyltransferase